MLATKNEIKVAQAIHGYRQDPVGFCTNILSLNPEYIWDKMVEMMESVRDNQFTAVRAGHSVSKTFTLGRIVVWFKTCYQPSTVVTTAPTNKLVEEQLWREIHASHSGSKIELGGKMTSLKWDLKPSKEVLDLLEPKEKEKYEKNLAIGFSTRADSASETATKMQGWHNDWALYIFDEACGGDPKIWMTAIDALVINEQRKMIAVGNPTDPECEFAKACYSSDPDKNNGNKTYTSDDGWNVITIDAMESPNYLSGKMLIPGLASRAHIDKLIKKHGIDSDRVRYRVKGLFPRFKEGTFYGAKLAAAKQENRIADEFRWDSNLPVHSFTDTGDKWTATIFAQFPRDRIRIIDCYWDNEGQGVPNWAQVLNSKPYVYGKEHFVGPELAAGISGRFQTGRATIDLACELGYNMQPIIHHKFDQGIECVRSIWELLDINKSKCQTFIKAASGYGKKKNEAASEEGEPEYHKEVAATWHRHMMDALRHLAIQYRYGKIGNKMMGFPHNIPAGLGLDVEEFADESGDFLTW